MSGLFGTMSTALSGLQAEQGALEVTTNNVANANTPGYSRQRPTFVENAPVVMGDLTFGTGVKLQNIESVRDPILELRLNDETQQQGQLDATVSAMQQAQVIFNANGSDLGTQITNFFSSLQQLSTSPASLAQRQGVLTAAGNLALAFRNATGQLQAQKNNIDLSVGQTVEQINTLTKQIAELNGQIAALENLHEDAGTFIDQRTSVIRDLSQLIDVSVVQSDTGITLTTSSGTALVAEQRSFALESKLAPSGVEHIYSAGSDITDKITAGKLGGLLDVRDQKIPALLSRLDTLAAGLVNGVNSAQLSGFDLAGAPGTNIFLPPPVAGVGAAAGMSVVMTDPTKLAASSDGSPGSNGNLTKLLDVQNRPIAAGQTPTDYYAGIVFDVGNDVANGIAAQDASNLILQQLQDQRSAISGVSMDEEASNLIRYQRAYEAAARVVTTVNDMTETAIQLGRY